MPDDSAFRLLPLSQRAIATLFLQPIFFLKERSPRTSQSAIAPNFPKYDRPYLPKVRSPLFSNQPIVLCVRTNPKPQNTCFNFYTQRPISLSSPYRAIITNLLKMQRRMRRICLQQLITLICCSLYI